ncbi:MAG: mechanosensitive ion channel family protein [Sulfurimonas sp.]|uniref:mechanosensitive ion channel family protein n=1 Tax=Sulfurimonas sp. TaxID=2022749 RepID=UPI0026333348|nr:mechanosensitive ion channel family protein [Sulfurimonas sp.]MCW8895772.1 mechanosensitive ion channel family protein [Sulfurimonas sp.]MCW8954306.1 mechanosensitive ion channel family protein [Sulfurimonas sp.]MCW9067845.1 mechanosensitive ion channel family protein [Sulfurimonas sp.]
MDKVEDGLEKELEAVGHFYNVVIEFITNYSFQIVGAIIILLIGVVASKYIHRYVLKLLLKTTIDETLGGFIANFVRFLVVAMMAILALGKLGISIAPFVAALGAISLTAGLALQGSVSNFAAGIVLIATKPFKIGDTIRVHDTYGEVEEIKLAYTILVNEDKEQITIPNKYMIGDVLVNSYSYRIVEGSVGIAYDSEVVNAINIIKDALSTCKEVSDENEPIIGIENFGDSSINIGYRYWVPTNKFFKIQYEVNLNVLQALNDAKITIPFPQREIRMLGDNNK